jgi:hypothetical protein
MAATPAGPAHGSGGHGPAAAAAAAARTASRPGDRSGPPRSGSQAAAPAAAPAPAGKQYPYLVYDSVIPDAIPAGHVVATYATGPQAVPASAVAGDKAVLWIDVNGTDPAASAVDVEPGDVTPNVVPGWVQARLKADPQGVAIIYTMLSEWPQVQAAVATLPSWMQARVRWWIADPTGYPHVVPGASATQWYWGPAYDISTALPGF